MDPGTLIQLGTMMSIVAGVIGLMISVRAYRRQVNAQFLLEYTKRVDDIVRTLPPSVWGAHLFPDVPLPEPSEELRLQILRCLVCIGQLHFFSHKGYLPKLAWRRAGKEFARVLATPVFVREWQSLAPMFADDRAFSRFVERSQRQQVGPPLAARAVGRDARME